MPTVSSLVSKVSQVILQPLIILLFAVAVVVFLWGVAQYVLNAGNPEKRTDGTKHIVWGVVGIFIMIAALSIIDVVTGTFGIPSV